MDSPSQKWRHPPNVVKAGGLEALKILGEPEEIIEETKKRLFAA